MPPSAYSTSPIRRARRARERAALVAEELGGDRVEIVARAEHRAHHRRRPLASAIARASRVLPVPDSPRIRIGASLCRQRRRPRRGPRPSTRGRSSVVERPAAATDRRGRARPRVVVRARTSISRWLCSTTADDQPAAAANSSSAARRRSAGIAEVDVEDAAPPRAPSAARSVCSGAAIASMMPRWTMLLGRAGASSARLPHQPAAPRSATRRISVRLISSRSRALSARPCARALITWARRRRRRAAPSGRDRRRPARRRWSSVSSRNSSRVAVVTARPPALARASTARRRGHGAVPPVHGRGPGRPGQGGRPPGVPRRSGVTRAVAGDVGRRHRAGRRRRESRRHAGLRCRGRGRTVAKGLLIHPRSSR